MLCKVETLREMALVVRVARETFAEAERPWKSGEDSDRVLDAGRFQGLKASLTAR